MLEEITLKPTSELLAASSLPASPFAEPAGHALEAPPAPTDAWAVHPQLEPPRIAFYRQADEAPLVETIHEPDIPRLLEVLAARCAELAASVGGRIPFLVIKELVDNLVHAAFAGVVITILDRGNTIRVSDRGPGIPDKNAAVRPGFTSADASAKRYIRGVGSGFSLAKQLLAPLGGTLEIEDNLGRGTVVTVRVPPPPDFPLAPSPVPAYNLPERQLKVLLLTVELAPVGPTRIAQELGVSTSTAYRDLLALEEAGLVASEPSGRRSVTEAGLAYLTEVF